MDVVNTHRDGLQDVMLYQVVCFSSMSLQEAKGIGHVIVIPWDVVEDDVHANESLYHQGSSDTVLNDCVIGISRPKDTICCHVIILDPYMGALSWWEMRVCRAITLMMTF